MTTQETQIVLARQGQTLFPTIEALVVKDQESLDIMVAHFAVVKEWLQKVDEHHAPMIEDAKKAVAAAKQTLETIEGKKAELRAPGEKVYKYANGQITGYVVSERNKQAERDRLARLDEEKRQQAARDKEVAKLERAGASPAQVRAIEQAPLPRTVATPAPVVAKPEGLVTSTHYSAEFEIDETRSLVALLVKGFGVSAKTMKMLSWMLPFLKINMPGVNAHARAAKEQFALPGFRLVKNSTSYTRD